jgi:hypothetical protein
MKSSLLTRAALAAFILAGFASASRATSVGFASSSEGNAFWDTFSSASFSGAAPTSSDTADFTATLDVSSGFVTGGGDRVYDFGAVSTFTINGTASSSISTLALQVKYSVPGIGAPADFFTVTPDFGGTFEQTLLGSDVIAGNTYFIYGWTWTGLELGESDAFSIQITGQADGHVSVDGLRVDAGGVSAVPEPASFAALAGVGTLAAAAFRRRRRA